MHAHAKIGRQRIQPTRRSFSLTELLVVIAIIVLLIALLLTALSTVKKKADRNKTSARMQQFVYACGTFQNEHGRYPGVIPDDVLNADAIASGSNMPKLSSTENALLELIGGCRVKSPQDTDPDSPTVKEYEAFKTTADNAGTKIELSIGGTDPAKKWSLVIDTRKVGEGPVINGKPHAPYFTPAAGDLVDAKYPPATDSDKGNKIPDLVDEWGQPIIYLRQSRPRGPLVRDNANATTAKIPPQFECGGIQCYLNSTALGETANNQLLSDDPNRGSILTINGSGWTGAIDSQNRVLATILSHPAFYNTGLPFNSQARGTVVLISAGPDGSFFAAVDGPGSPNTPINATNLASLVTNQGPGVIDEFDDIRVYGGG